ncbi:Uncharacterised protein [Leminorella richardii]|uniref:Uncharacterized protein n=1 Tax=Leminorella richardii TaxID=158841 RepID=A0A2X4UZK1_9GAMM|nr:hypothetical protein [Leminorella richardii]SQI40052.1 Uncharacterised protein [Leminorella richardii]
MKKLKIDKYVDRHLDESFTIPLGFIHLLKGLLPASAIESLNQHGIALEDIIAAAKQGLPYQTSIEVEEKAVMKKIAFTLQ